MVDAPEGVLGIEWIDGKSVRFLLGGGAEGEEEEEGDVDDDFAEDFAETEEDPLQEFSITQGEPLTAWCIKKLSYPLRRFRHGVDRDRDR